MDKKVAERWSRHNIVRFRQNIIWKSIHELPVVTSFFLGGGGVGVTGGWTKLCNEEHHNLYSSLNIIRIIK